MSDRGKSIRSEIEEIDRNSNEWINLMNATLEYIVESSIQHKRVKKKWTRKSFETSRVRVRGRGSKRDQAPASTVCSNPARRPRRDAHTRRRAPIAVSAEGATDMRMQWKEKGVE